MHPRTQLIKSSKRFLQTLPSQVNSNYQNNTLPLTGNALSNSTTSSPWISHSLPTLARAKPFAARLSNEQKDRQSAGAVGKTKSTSQSFLDPGYKPITLEFPPSAPTPASGNAFARALNNHNTATPAKDTQENPASLSSPTTATSSSSSSSQATAKRPARKFRPRKAAITVTPNALAHVRQLQQGPNPKLVKIGVRNRGCSGLTYHLEYVDKAGAFDEEVMQDGVKVLIDSKALFSIIGSEMDYVDDKLSSRFVFNNPNSKGQCGCGESFMV